MIDWERLSELRSDLGDEEFLPALELFVDEVESVAMRLSMDNAAQLERDLHFMKGSASNLGFDTFAAMCGEFEEAASRGNTMIIDIDALLEVYAESKALLSRSIAGGIAEVERRRFRA